MRIELFNKTERNFWNSFILENNGSFLQSFEWGEFQKKQGNKIWRLIIKQKSDIICEVLLIKQNIRFKQNYLYIPYGPCFRKKLNLDDKKNALKIIIAKSKEIAGKHRAIFLKIEPYREIGEIKLVKSVVFARERIQPQKTLIKDISQPEQVLLKEFNRRIRYNINLARKKGVVILCEETYNPVFFKLMLKTSKRNNFRCFPEKHYKEFFDIKSSDLKIKMCLAKFDNRIISANILLFFNKTAIVLHGASDIEFRAIKANNLLQWEQMKIAKQLGCVSYDFWGIDDNKWPGVTAFKKGFGGDEISYPRGFDIVFNKLLYNAYKLAKKII